MTKTVGTCRRKEAKETLPGEESRCKKKNNNKTWKTKDNELDYDP